MNKKLKNKNIKFIFGVLLLITLNFVSIPSFLTPVTKSTNNIEEIKSSGVYYDVEINDLPISPVNWSWAETQPWFGGGSGTLGSPYVIEGHTFEYSMGSGLCFGIRNSRKHFIINNCTFSGSDLGNAGLLLQNVTNGQIRNNTIFNNVYGIQLYDTNYTSINENNVHDNSNDGIHLYDNYYNNINQNYITRCGDGLELDNCQFNNIFDNVIYENDFEGLEFYYCHFNTIYENNLYLNEDHGFELDDSENNTIYDNIIRESTEDGINLDIDCYDNLFYNNYFIDNGYDNAVDQGTGNNWNNSLIGNYWDDYTGYDMDLDGIGDTPYDLAPPGGSQDYLPIWNQQAPIAIDDFPGSLNNWTWAASQAWCSGSGTELDPYVIEDMNIDAKNADNCISILNSRAFFTIRNCILYKSGATDAGIYLLNVTNGNIANNQLDYNYVGLYLDDCNFNTISGNNVSHNGNNGIHLSYSHNNTIIQNNANHNDDEGIYIYFSDNNTIQENTAYNNSYNGIRINWSGNNYVIENNVTQNTGTGNDGNGIRLYDAVNNTIINNYVTENNMNGILLITNSNDNIITGNFINDNNLYGVYVGSGDDNLFYDNYFRSNVLENARDDGTGNDWNNTLIGNYWDDYTGYDMDLDGIGDDPHSIIGSAGNFDYLPIWNILGPIAIDDLPGSLNNWAWAENQAWCSGSGTSGDPYLIEYLKIHGNSTHSCIDIQNSDSNFVIDHCELNNSINAGIYLSNVTNGRLTNNYLSNNSYGVYLYENCDFNIISQNTAYKNSWQGIRINDSDNNTISGNILNNNGGTIRFHGLGVYHSDGNSISNNIANNNNAHGIRISSSEFNTLTENTLENNGDRGISIGSSSHHNTLLQNTANNNTNCGIYVEESNFNNISENTASDNALANFYLLNSNNTTLYRNIADGISNYGIYLERSNFNNLIECEVYNISSRGIYLYYSNNNSISKNIGMYNLYGLFAEYSNENTFSQNSFNNNTQLGIAVQYTYGNKILENTANFNTNIWGGIVLSVCVDTLVQGNTIIGNNPSGILIFNDADNNNVTGNIVKENTFGIDIWAGSDNNLIYENFFLKNGMHAVDGGSNNDWNSTTIGNYWDNHTGPDTIPPYGIVDIQYNISGSAGSIDYLPIAEDGSPSIIINSPSENDIFGTIAPSFSVTISDDFLDEMWYTIDGGLHNYTFTGSTGTINQSAWEAIADGMITLIFYASDAPGNIGSAEVNIEKDSHGPLIIISSPHTDDIFGANTPSFTVEISDDNLDSMWYSLDGGTTIFLFTANGTIDQTAWTALLEGSVTITFYANDTLGNLETESVDVVKSLPSPPPEDNFLVIIIIVISIVAGVAVVTVVLLLRRRKAGVEV